MNTAGRLFIINNSSLSIIIPRSVGPSYPDHMLYSLKQKKLITESDYIVRLINLLPTYKRAIVILYHCILLQLFVSLYQDHNPTFLQAMRAAHGNEEVLLQMLASIKPDHSVYQTSQQ